MFNFQNHLSMKQKSHLFSYYFYQNINSYIETPLSVGSCSESMRNFIIDKHYKINDEDTTIDDTSYRLISPHPCSIL